MSDMKIKPPVWFWIVSVILLLWGLMGAWVYYDFQTATPESMAKAVTDGLYSQEYVDYFLNGYSAWHVAVFAIAVFSGLLGAISLVMRKRWAVPLYALSLICIIISFVKTFLIDKAHTIMNGTQIGMETVVLILAIFALWFSRKAKTNGWIN